MASDKVPGTPCKICGKPTDHPYDGADVYHAVCLKKRFPNSTLHLMAMNNPPPPEWYDEDLGELFDDEGSDSECDDQ